MVSFAIVFILQLLKTVGKKKKRRNHPQQSTRIIFEYFRSWQTLVILAKRPYCDHPTTILSCRITLVVKFASISIPIVSKSFGNKKKRRNHPQHWVTVIFEYFRIWQTEAVLPKCPYCDHPTTIQVVASRPACIRLVSVQIGFFSHHNILYSCFRTQSLLLPNHHGRRSTCAPTPKENNNRVVWNCWLDYCDLLSGVPVVRMDEHR